MSEAKTCCVEAAAGEDWDAPIALVMVLWGGGLWSRIEQRTAVVDTV